MAPRIALLVVVTASLLMGMTLIAETSDVDTVHARSDAFWAFSRLNAQEVEGYSSLVEMADAADQVILGRIVDTGTSREFEETLADGTVEKFWYGHMTVSIERVFRGRSAADVMDLEVFLPTRRMYDAFVHASLPTERTVFFVRSKEAAALAAGWSDEAARAEAPYSMLVNLSQSYFREFDGLVHVPDPGAEDFTSTWEGASFSDMLDELED